MTPVDMLNLEHGKPGATPGDCFRCCVASLLDLPAESVPHFCDFPSPEVHWINRTQKWLSNRGLWMLTVSNVQWGFLTRGLRPLLIVGGKSPRGPWGHCVVGEVSRDGFRLIHDPHPSRTGIIGDPEDYTLLVRLDLPPNSALDRVDPAPGSDPV